MTDEKIKKALECCTSETDCMCSQCPLNKDEDCLDNLPKYALAFIDQQQAEIERLKYLLKCEETKYDRCAKQLYKAGAKKFAAELKCEENVTRGKTLDGKWIEGFLFPEQGEGVTRWCITKTPLSANDYSEIMGDYAEINLETIGRYTGLPDKNGKKIFEGDIILYGLIPCVVKYETENARFMLYENGKYIKNGFNVDTMKLKEVIGNIYDNPELLKGE